MEKPLYPVCISNQGVAMDRKLDEFFDNAPQRVSSTPEENPPRKRRKRLKSTSLESFLPEEHVEYFKKLRIGSKKIRNARIEEL